MNKELNKETRLVKESEREAGGRDMCIVCCEGGYNAIRLMD